MIYILILIYIIFLIIKYPRFNQSAIFAYHFLYVILVLVVGFRYNVGIDTSRYMDEYKTFPTLSNLSEVFIKESNYKILWIIFESSIRTLSDSFYLIQIILAVFVNTVVFRVIRIYSLNPFLTLLFYYLLFYLNLNTEILRESIPICIL